MSQTFKEVHDVLRGILIQLLLSACLFNCQNILRLGAPLIWLREKNSFIDTTVVHYLGKEVKSIDYRYRFALWCVSEVFHLRRHS